MDLTQVRKLIDDNFSIQWCRDNYTVPIGVVNNTLILAVANLSYLAAIGDVVRERAKFAGYELQVKEMDHQDIERTIDDAAKLLVRATDSGPAFEFSEDTIQELLIDENALDEIDWDQLAQEATDRGDDVVEDLADDLDKESVIKAVAKILIKAYQDGASDIHIEPSERDLRIRFRIDGVLRTFVALPPYVTQPLTARIKVMSGLNIAERRLPQDGRIQRVFKGQQMDFRVSTLPGRFGEKTVLRLLDSNAQMLRLNSLITNSAVLDQLRTMIRQPYGIILVVGPTGSGKSTTLYSAINEINTEGVNIVTAEDPIEYTLPGIHQVQIVREKGVDFARILRAFMRQDPDVMLVGETRDPETAKTSMEAALTGHLVFTTLHANTAAAAVTRLAEMGVPDYLTASSVIGILAQRLMRRLCPDCNQPHEITAKEAELFGLPEGFVVRSATELTKEEKVEAAQRGRLCRRCEGRGYSGRVGVYELMPVERDLRRAILEGKGTEEIEQIAVSKGMLTLEAYGTQLVREGLSTLAELQRVCSGDKE
jgi:type IV pilus assembly protein PilB